MELPLLGGARDVRAGMDAQYFLASNPTPGTGIAGHAAPTTFDETKPLLYVFNPNIEKRLLPMYLRLTCTAAGSGLSTVQFTQTIDGSLYNQGGTAPTTKYSSGGTQLVPVGTNMMGQAATRALIYFGAVVVSAATGARRVLSNQTYRSVIGVVGDVYQFNWAAHEVSDPASLITTGTAISNVTFGYPPVVIGPGQSFAVHQWAGSQSGAPSFQCEFAYVELPIG